MSEEEKKAIDNFKKLDFFDYDWQISDNNFETRDEMLLYAEKMQKIIINLIEKQQKEIEEKTTILLAGAEKVKQLEKGNRSLMESRIKWKNRYYKEKAKNKEFISKDKIREKLDKYREKLEKLHSQELWNEPKDSIKDFKYNHYLEAYNELLEE